MMFMTVDLRPEGPIGGEVAPADAGPRLPAFSHDHGPTDISVQWDGPKIQTNIGAGPLDIRSVITEYLRRADLGAACARRAA